MQDLEELLAQMADARKIYGKEPVAPYHGGNRVSGSSAGSRVDATRAVQHANRQPARADLPQPGGQALAVLWGPGHPAAAVREY